MWPSSGSYYYLVRFCLDCYITRKMINVNVLSKTIRVTVLSGRKSMDRFEVITAFRSKFPDLFKFVTGVWKMEAPTAWYITFSDTESVV